MEMLGTPESRHAVIFVLGQIGKIEEARGEVDSALAHYEESLAIARQLVEGEETRDWLNLLVWSAQLCASIEILRSLPDAALVRLESFVQQATKLESATDANTLDTAAAYWERRTEALDALGWASEAAESRARALVLRTRIAEMVTD
jgi:tetratricopeptide (TPR) repeat protein